MSFFIETFPFVMVISFRIAIKRDDFPAPTLPITATLSELVKEKERFLRMGFSSVVH